jgi:lysophospholipase L1-like esterase
LLPGEVAPTTDQVVGLYASGVPGEFGSSGHASFWGRQAMQTKDTIHEWVAEYQPDYLLILLGFNDLGWFVSGPEGLLGTMGTLIENAREAKSDIKILMANVVDRFFINGRDDLVENTLAYNNMLRSTYSNWVRLESPLSYVELNANYQCRPDACPDGYDGLHPNSMGEYHIAEAFARSLKADFYFDGDDFVVPSNPEARVVSTPTGVQALQVDEGILATWLADPEARGYEIRSRVQGMTGWWSDGEIGNGNRNYYTWLLDGQTWEFQVCTRGDNDVRSDWGSIASTTAHPKTAPGPPNIVVVPSGDGIQFTWGAVTGYSINRYAVIVWDQDTDGAFISTYGAAGTSFFIGGLVAGHRYSTWVATWVNLSAGPAGGLPVAGRDVIIGGGAPAPPANIQVTNIDPTTVQLTWSGSAGAAGYAIYYRSTSGSSDYTQIGTVTETSEVVGFLFPGTWHYQYCVSAYNGNMESSHTACIIPPVYPGYTKRDELKGDSTVVANTSRVYNSTTMMQDTRLRNMFAKISQNSTILPSL